MSFVLFVLGLAMLPFAPWPGLIVLTIAGMHWKLGRLNRALKDAERAMRRR